MEKLDKKTIIIIVAVLVGLFFIFNLSSKGNSLSPIQTTEGTDLTIVDTEVLDTLKKVQDIKLDSSVFSNPVFNVLIDFSRQIVDEPVGKPNPFQSEDVQTDEQVQYEDVVQ